MKKIGGIKLTEQEQMRILMDVKAEFQKVIETYPNSIQTILNEYPPWNFYEDSNGNNVFRVIGVDDINDEICLRCVKLEGDEITEIIGVKPDYIKPTPGWKSRQLELINRSPFPDGFLNPLGYLGIIEIMKQQEKN